MTVSNRTRALFIHFCEYGDLESTPIVEQFQIVSSKPDFDINMVCYHYPYQLFIN